MDLGTLFVKCIKYRHILSNIGRKLHLMMASVSLPLISLVYEAYFLCLQGPKGVSVFSLLIFNFVFKGAKRCFCVFVVDIQFCVYRGQRVFLHFCCWYSMKTRYVVLRTPKHLNISLWDVFSNSCVVVSFF